MTAFLYVKLDVNYADDPKVLSVTPQAELLYVRSLCLAKRLVSDGYLHRSHLMRLGSDLPSDPHDAQAVDGYAKELVEVGLWEPVEDGSGWRISAWAKHNESAGAIAEKRAAKRDGALLGNHRRWHTDKPSEGCRYCESLTDRSPNPSEEEAKEEAKKRKRKSVGRSRATRRPDDWQPNDQHREFAFANHLNLDREQAQFCDHHDAKGSTFKDWDAAFRTWLRNAVEFGGSKRGRGGTTITNADGSVTEDFPL